MLLEVWNVDESLENYWVMEGWKSKKLLKIWKVSKYWIDIGSLKIQRNKRLESD